MAASPLWKLNRIIETQSQKAKITKDKIQDLINYRNAFFFNAICNISIKSPEKVFLLKQIYADLERNKLLTQEDFDRYQDGMQKASDISMELVIIYITEQKKTTDRTAFVSTLKQLENSIEVHVKHYHKLAGSVNMLSKNSSYLVLFQSKNLPIFKGLPQVLSELPEKIPLRAVG